MISEIQVFFLSMTPIGELRASLPIALTVYRMDWAAAYFISVVGNLVPAVLILLFLKPISDWLSKNSGFFQKLFFRLFERAKKSYNSRFEKPGKLALIIFVAIPLPLTGAWTASIIAVLFGIPFKKAFPMIFIGILMAGLIVSAITFAGISVEKYFGWQVLTGFLLIVGLLWIMNKIIKNNNNKIGG